MPEQDLSTSGWAVRYVLTKEGSNRFDRVAKKLYNQTPHGLIAIIVDDSSSMSAPKKGKGNDPDGIAAGVLTHGDEVTFACVPHLWRLVDTDGDGRADVRRSLSEGYGVNMGFFGHDLHGLIRGPDGRLYFSIGDRGFHVQTDDGRVLSDPKRGAVLRCEMDGSGLEVVATGLRNPQELCFDDFGNLFTGDNNGDGADKARWVHVIEGGDSGWRYAYQWINRPNLRGPWNAEKLWHPPHAGQAAYVVPPIANLARYEHRPAGQQGNCF